MSILCAVKANRSIDVLGFSSLLIIIHSNILKVNEVFYE